MKNILIALLLSINLFATEIGQHNINKYIYIDTTSESKYVIKKHRQISDCYMLIDKYNNKQIFQGNLIDMLDYLLEHNFNIYREIKALVDIPEYNQNREQ